MPAKKKLYTIIEEDRVGRTLAEAAVALSYPNLERVFDALVWRLARAPDCGQPFTGQDGVEYRLVRPLPLKGARNPSILARYIFDPKEETVTIDWITVYPYNDAEAVSVEEYEL